jgi:hypothetical protein
MQIVKMNKLKNGVVEVEFDDGTKSQFREDKLVNNNISTKPEDFYSQVKEIYSNDIGSGKENS